ncbi:uncharacterized protein LOC121049600 isoform X1 [Rosa chinensis]|uniref:uncharacterized protein LOC121049600 isoform X1 n=1 Tax=Rosa chinensis TaxID=74649 RepID=UPI001AD907B6|nr:uncharacterized protein LOC121049600 isoform X1 [Rosa chinensis]XP_040363324.1 uncharacterized protein LOC121049600 isoform X1 [Rosa chinensis]
MLTTRWLGTEIMIKLVQKVFTRSGFRIEHMTSIEPGLGYVLFQSDFAIANLMFGKSKMEYTLGDENGNSIQLGIPENLFLNFDSAIPYPFIVNDVKAHFEREKFNVLGVQFRRAEEAVPRSCHVSLERSPGFGCSCTWCSKPSTNVILYGKEFEFKSTLRIPLQWWPLQQRLALKGGCRIQYLASLLFMQAL